MAVLQVANSEIYWLLVFVVEQVDKKITNIRSDGPVPFYDNRTLSLYHFHTRNLNLSRYKARNSTTGEEAAQCLQNA